MLLSRQAGGDSAATPYPLSLAPSPPLSIPASPPPARASLPLASPPPLHPRSHTPEALEQSRPTLGNRYSHHHSPPPPPFARPPASSPCISPSLTQCLHGQRALLINRGHGFQWGERGHWCGTIFERWKVKKGTECNIVCLCSFSLFLCGSTVPSRSRLLLSFLLHSSRNKGQFKRVEYF